MGGTRRSALRNATTAVHRALDRRMGAFETLPEYGSYLRTMVVFRRSVEAGFQQQFTSGPHGRMNDRRSPEGRSHDQEPHEHRPHEQQCILADLEQDCRDTGTPIPAARLSFEHPTNRSAELGVRYVLEGSSLGAQLLARRAAALGLGPDRGGRHLATLVSSRGWAGFLAELEGCSPFDIDLACAAALETFELALAAADRVSHDVVC